MTFRENKPETDIPAAQDTAPPDGHEILPPLKRIILLAVIIGLASGVGAYLIWQSPMLQGSDPSPGMEARPVVGEGQISFAAAAFADGKARYYAYQTARGIKVRFFILQSPDKTIRTAFDACNACWRTGKGYAQEDEFMVCRSCGRRFASRTVDEEKGKCNPLPLKRRLEKGRVIITLADIASGMRLFDLSAPESRS